MRGYVSRVAYDGHDAQQACDAETYDVLLLDLGLPDMSGYEVCRHVRASAARQPLVIALTGWGQERDRSATADAGFDGHLLKPVDPRTLLSTLASLLDRKKTAPAVD